MSPSGSTQDIPPNTRSEPNEPLSGSSEAPLSSSQPRSYHSPLRERHAARTRADILDALAQVIVDNGTGEFSIPEVAERAGVATRTVYRHFPNRQTLLDALTEQIDDRMVQAYQEEFGSSLQEIADREEYLAAIPWVFRKFEDMPELAEAVVLTSVGGRFRSRAHDERTRQFRSLLESDLACLDPNEADATFAVIRALVAPRTWFTMRDEFAVRGEAAGRAVARSVRAILREAREGAGADSI